jgi:hypothetical protein
MKYGVHTDDLFSEEGEQVVQFRRTPGARSQNATSTPHETGKEMSLNGEIGRVVKRLLMKDGPRIVYMSSALAAT